MIIKTQKKVIKPLFIGGPSGVGKSYFTKYLVENFDFKKVITLTTRSPRRKEVYGESYEFVTTDEFKFLDKTHQLDVSDNILGNYYGLRKNSIEQIIQIGKIPICEIYSPHVQLFTEIFPDSICIFLMPESIELIETRMRERNDDKEDIIKRIISAKEEISLFIESTHKYFSHIHTVSETNFFEVINNIIKIFYENTLDSF